MNHRDYKISSPGEYFHIYNRGNAKQDIFLAASDYQFFFLRLAQNIYPDRNDLPRRARPLPTGSFSLISYCFMPNHFHLLIRQNLENTTGVLMARVCTSYSKYFNEKYHRVGHLFQDQFKQKHVPDNQYLLTLSAYIHQNPRKDGLVENALEYPWSSYAEYVSGKSGGWCEKQSVLDQFPDTGSYHQFVEGCDNLAMMPIDT